MIQKLRLIRLQYTAKSITAGGVRVILASSFGSIICRMTLKMIHPMKSPSDCAALPHNNR